MNTVFVIDTGSRYLELSACSITREPEDGPDMRIILRKGASLGPLEAIQGIIAFPYPMVLMTRGYSAKSSAGYVDVTAQFGFSLTLSAACGFRWRRSLGRLEEPQAACILPAGCVLRSLQTEKNRNPATAQAAHQGYTWWAEQHHQIPRIQILAGQWDTCQGWEILPPSSFKGWPAGGPDIPLEHEGSALFRIREMPATTGCSSEEIEAALRWAEERNACEQELAKIRQRTGAGEHWLQVGADYVAWVRDAAARAEGSDMPLLIREMVALQNLAGGGIVSPALPIGNRGNV